MVFSRKASDNEILYCDYGELYSTFDIQFVIESKGKIQRESFEEAVNLASEACPIFRCKLTKGYFWLDSFEQIPIYFENHFVDETYNNILKRKIDYRNNPVSEIWIIGEYDHKIIFRAFHGAVDGKGLLLWIENIFGALRGEELVKYEDRRNDLEYLKSLRYKKVNNKLSLNKSLLNVNKKKNLKVIWERVTINKKEKNIISKVAKVLSENFKGDNKFLVPVDIRRWNKEIYNINNLSLPIFLDVKEDEDVRDIHKNLMKALINGEELNLASAKLGLITKLNKHIRKLLIESMFFIERKKCKFPISGILSDLGEIDITKFELKTLKIESFYSIPMAQVFTPISLVSTQYKDKIELVFSTYEGFFKEREFHKLMKKMVDMFTPEYELIEGAEVRIPHRDILEFLSNEDYKNNIAIYYEGREITYRELTKYVNNFSFYLKVMGVKKGDEVIIYLQRTPYFIIALLGLMKIGAIYIPIDNENKINEEIFKDIKWIIVDLKTEENKFEKNIKKIRIESMDLITHNKTIKNESVEEGDIIYKIYTSGTTGKAKGVSITHGALNNYLTSFERISKNIEMISFPLFTSIGVDLTITAIFPSLISGGAIEIFKDKFNRKVINKILMSKKINSIKLTPTHLTIFNKHKENFKNVDLFIVGGEPLIYKEAFNLEKNTKHKIRIINEYGPTEATIGCVVKEFSNLEICEEVPIGKPIINTKIILKYEDYGWRDNCKVGEVFIAGKSLSKGYDNKEITEKYFKNILGVRVYKTGDLAYVKGGEIFFVGRLDSQVKINGRRIELGYIESIIKSIEFINLVKVEINNKKEIIAYCTLFEGGNYYAKDIIVILQQKLEDYMIPKKINLVKDIDMSISGKLGNVKIYKEFQGEPKNVINPIREFLINLWKEEVTEGENFNEQEDFYSIGGDSATLITMISIIIEKYIGSREEEFLRDLEEFYDELTIENIEILIRRYYEE